MSDPKPLGHSYGADLRIGYEQSNHELEWPAASGDCGPVDCFGHETHGQHPPRLIVWDAKGRVILRIDE